MNNWGKGDRERRKGKKRGLWRGIGNRWGYRRLFRGSVFPRRLLSQKPRKEKTE
jgi:hypothetical protein